MKTNKLIVLIPLIVTGLLIVSYLIIRISLVDVPGLPKRVTPTDFSYNLNSGAQKPDEKLTTKTSKNSISFNTSFKSGGGNFEAAKLVKQENIYQVVLYDTDNKLQNMIVSYDLSGEIKNIPPGTYTLQIVGVLSGKNTVLMEESFQIP